MGPGGQGQTVIGGGSRRLGNGRTPTAYDSRLPAYALGFSPTLGDRGDDRVSLCGGPTDRDGIDEFVLEHGELLI
jgi:hypothetical protein